MCQQTRPGPELEPLTYLTAESPLLAGEVTPLDAVSKMRDFSIADN